jgi:hypothetical protein
MTKESRRALVAAYAEHIRNYGSLLFGLAERFYEARMERAQMRLAPTTGVRKRKHSACPSGV